jgi:hypothetical protein
MQQRDVAAVEIGAIERMVSLEAKRVLDSWLWRRAAHSSPLHVPNGSTHSILMRRTLREPTRL